MLVYADNAATTKMSRTAVEAMLPYLDEIYGNPSSLHTAGQRSSAAIQGAHSTVAELLHADAKEIIFTSGGSEADNQAILSAAAWGAKCGKKHVISTAFEHHAVLHTLRKLERDGYDVTLLPVHENGIVTAEEVAAAIRDDTCLVSVMFVNNEIGTIQPIEEIGAVCRARGVLFHTDAVQAAGKIPVDLKDWNVDYATFSCHKIYGPKGVGALYARRGVLLTSLIEGGAQERGKRAGTENVPGIVATAAALRESCDHISETSPRLIRLRNKLIDGLQAIPHAALNGDAVQRLPGNVNFCFEGIEGESLLLLLDQKGIEASSGSACTSGALDPSHVLLAIGRPHEVAHGSLRLSLSCYTTEEEVDYMLREIPPVVEYLRSMSPVWKDMERGVKPHLL